MEITRRSSGLNYNGLYIKMVMKLFILFLWIMFTMAVLSADTINNVESDSHLTKAKEYTIAKDYESALKEYEEFLKMAPERKQEIIGSMRSLYFSLVNSAFIKGDNKRAMEIYTRWKIVDTIENIPENIREGINKVFLNEAKSSYEKGLYQQALSLIESRLEFEPNCLEANFIMASCFDKLGQKEKAKSYFEKVIGIDKDSDYGGKAQVWMDKEFPSSFVNSIGMKFVLIKAGTFLMGSPEGEEERDSFIKDTQHKVTITKDFWLQTTEVIQAQYEEIMENNPSYFKGKDLPVEQVSWWDAVEFCERLSEKEGKEYRLPTEEEWEYACRAGSQTRYSFGDDEGRFGEYAWYDANSDSKTHSVGQKKPNVWGLYDMHGNVWEWCRDRWGSYPSGEYPTGTVAGSNIKVLRGGSWVNYPLNLRSANRGRNYPDYRINCNGFRCARTP